MSVKQTLNDWLPFLEKEAKLGNPDAMGILACMYRDGCGVEKDLDKAQELFDKERNASSFDLPDDDDSNPWVGNAVKV